MPKTGLCWLWITALVLIVDRFTKYWATKHLLFTGPMKILPILNFTLAFNTGAAFSFLHNANGWQNIFLGGLAIVVSLFVLVWLSRLSCKARWNSIALCLVLGGALGNVWDRAMYQYVIDFLSFHWGDWYFAIFNVADSAICVGAVMLCLLWFKQAESN